MLTNEKVLISVEFYGDHSIDRRIMHFLVLSIRKNDLFFMVKVNEWNLHVKRIGKYDEPYHHYTR